MGRPSRVVPPLDVAGPGLGGHQRASPIDAHGVAAKPEQKHPDERLLGQQLPQGAEVPSGVRRIFPDREGRQDQVAPGRLPQQHCPRLRLRRQVGDAAVLHVSRLQSIAGLRQDSACASSHAYPCPLRLKRVAAGRLHSVLPCPYIGPHTDPNSWGRTVTNGVANCRP